MKRFLPLLLAALLALTISCTINQKIELKIDGSGTGEVRIVLHPMLISYSMDLIESFGSGSAENTGIFDLNAIDAQFAEKRSVELISASVPSPDTLDLKIKFTNLEEVFTESAEAGADQIFTYSKSGEIKKVQLHLTAENFNQVAALSPGENSDLLMIFGPQANNPYTEEEYMEMIEYAFFEYTEGVDLKDVMELSIVTLDISVDGSIVSQKGGRQDGNTVTFEVPLLKLLTLNTPIDYEISFK